MTVVDCRFCGETHSMDAVKDCKQKAKPSANGKGVFIPQSVWVKLDGQVKAYISRAVREAVT